MTRPNNFLFALIVLSLLISSCAPAASSPSATLVASSTNSPTPTPSLTLTATPRATLTPAPPTVTPLPTIPTFTPTFDVRTIVTATPAPKAECPKEDQNIQITLPPTVYFDQAENWIKLDDVVLEYLNKGGTLQNLIKAYSGVKDLMNAINELRPSAIDLTNDNTPEIIIINPMSELEKPTPAIYVFSCNRGKYSNIFSWRMPHSIAGVENLMTLDINANGIPELFIQTGVNFTDKITKMWIYEWNGTLFQSLLTVPYKPSGEMVYQRGTLDALNLTYRDDFLIMGNYNLAFRDIDKNKTIELIVELKNVAYSDGPARDPKITYAWNGNYLYLYRIEYPQPKYRFQAIQDGDDATQFQEYDKAVTLYQDVIFNSQLDWYSKTRQSEFGFYWNAPTPTIDLTEYPRLAAYAYYRMIILHTFLGETEAAQIKYDTLQQKFPEGDPGHPYVEMAIAFWDAYQSTQKMYDACAAAIQYADEHPEILIPLGSDYHGSQSHRYVPADVCPFR
jgi:hypothetical protein